MSILQTVHDKGLLELQHNKGLNYRFWDLLFDRATGSISKKILMKVAMRVGDNPTGNDFTKEQVTAFIEEMIRKDNSETELVHSDAVRSAVRICLNRALYLDCPDQIFGKIVEHFTNLSKE